MAAGVVRAPTEDFGRVGGRREDLTSNEIGIALTERRNDLGLPVKQQHLARVPATELEVEIHEVSNGRADTRSDLGAGLSDRAALNGHELSVSVR